MTTGRIGIIATGALGVCILIWLCVWQLQRLEWKEGVIAEMEGRMAADPAPLPEAFDVEDQEFSRVVLRGRFTGEKGAHGFADAPLLVTIRPLGAGYRVIQPFILADSRRVMVDRGYIPVAEKNESGAAALPTPAPVGEIEIVGALRWPVSEYDEGPAFGARDNVWTGRDLPEMVELFDAEEALVVLETSTAVGEWPKPLPLEAVKIKNDHLEYAITWGSLAFVWALMTCWLAFRRT
ncbi:MAG: SURF1 family protein [Pseudomonadota bacterium]